MAAKKLRTSLAMAAVWGFGLGAPFLFLGNWVANSFLEPRGAGLFPIWWITLGVLGGLASLPAMWSLYEARHGSNKESGRAHWVGGGVLALLVELAVVYWSLANLHQAGMTEQARALGGFALGLVMAAAPIVQVVLFVLIAAFGALGMSSGGAD